MVFQGNFMVSHSFWLVSIVFKVVSWCFMVSHGFWLVSMGFQGSFTVTFLHQRRSVGSPCQWCHVFAPKEVGWIPLSVKKIIFPLPHYPARPCCPYGGFCLVLQIFAEFHLQIPAELQIRRRISTKFLLLTCKMGNAPNKSDFKFGVFQYI